MVLMLPFPFRRFQGGAAERMEEDVGWIGTEDAEGDDGEDGGGVGG